MDVKLSENALRIFNTLYCKDDETPFKACQRVASEFNRQGSGGDIALRLLLENKWRPNTPVWFNSHTKQKLFSACWVVPLEDSMDGIYDAVNICRKIFSYGAGVGIPIGNLREKDAPIFGAIDKTAPCWVGEIDHDYDANGECKICGKTEFPQGKSSGPIVFMKLYDAAADTTKSGGRARRAAIKCDMQDWHPDVLDYIKSKDVEGHFANMNISVKLSDKFFQSLKDNTPFPLHTPYDGSFVRNEDPNLIWNELCNMAWKTGDPGVMFSDTVQKFNPLKAIMLIEATNPCLWGKTVVETDKGMMRIEDIKDWDDLHILSYNVEEDRYEFDKIIDVIWSGRLATHELEIEEDGVIYLIRCTPEHKFYTRNRGWVEARLLDEKDDIVIKK